MTIPVAIYNLSYLDSDRSVDELAGDGLQPSRVLGGLGFRASPDMAAAAGPPWPTLRTVPAAWRGRGKSTGAAAGVEEERQRGTRTGGETRAASESGGPRSSSRVHARMTATTPGKWTAGIDLTLICVGHSYIIAVCYCHCCIETKFSEVTKMRVVGKEKCSHSSHKNISNVHWFVMILIIMPPIVAVAIIQRELSTIVAPLASRDFYPSMCRFTSWSPSFCDNSGRKIMAMARW